MCTIADSHRDAPSGLPLRASGLGSDSADRIATRPTFRGYGDLPVEACRSSEDPGVGWE